MHSRDIHYGCFISNPLKRCYSGYFVIAVFRLNILPDGISSFPVNVYSYWIKDIMPMSQKTKSFRFIFKWRGSCDTETVCNKTLGQSTMYGTYIYIRVRYGMIDYIMYD